MERNPASPCPQLLVSVRSAGEAREAIAGGCDILDVKEPRRGSLGAASPAVIREVSHAGSQSGLPVSAALGECGDWLKPEPPLEIASLAGSNLQFVKLGLAGMGRRDDWSAAWLSIIARCCEPFDRGPRPVAVIYADWQAARAPQPEEILDVLATEAGSEPSGRAFAGVLVDTFEKSSGRLLDAMSLETLRAIRDRTAEFGMFLALAGRLNAELLPSLVDVAPDIIAIRSAACGGEDRTASVDRDAVTEFRSAMRSSFEMVGSP